jgi:hypothetical protein
MRARRRPCYVWRGRRCRSGVRAGRPSEFAAMLRALDAGPLPDSERVRMLAELDAAARPVQPGLL